MKTLIFEITWSGSQTATLQYLRDNLIDALAGPQPGVNGRITLAWPASTELAHDIDWDLWAAGATLTNLKAVARWANETDVRTLAQAETAEHHWRTGGRL